MDETSTCKDTLPKKELEELFARHNSNPVKLQADIEASEQAYMANVERLIALKKKKEEEKAALNAKTPVRSTGSKKRKQVLTLGLKVAAQLYNREAYQNIGEDEVKRLQKDWAVKNAGNTKLLKKGWLVVREWYEGEVTQIRLNEKRKKVYACTFNSPNLDILEYDTTRLRACLKSYEDLQTYQKRQRSLLAHSQNKSDTLRSSPEWDDGLSDDDVPVVQPALTLGTKVRHGINVEQSSSGPRVFYHNGEVIQLRKLPTGAYEYCCSFEKSVPAACWFSEEKTVQMASTYVSFEKNNPLVEERDRVACKGSNQRQQVSDACYVVVRTKVLEPKTVNPQVDHGETLLSAPTIVQGMTLLKGCGENFRRSLHNTSGRNKNC